MSIVYVILDLPWATLGILSASIVVAAVAHGLLTRPRRR